MKFKPNTVLVILIPYIHFLLFYHLVLELALIFIYPPRETTEYCLSRLLTLSDNTCLKTDPDSILNIHVIQATRACESSLGVGKRGGGLKYSERRSCRSYTNPVGYEYSYGRVECGWNSVFFSILSFDETRVILGVIVWMFIYLISCQLR